MNIGFDVIEEIERVKERASRLGFVLAKPKYPYDFDSCISLIPKDQDSLPIYTRDADIFSGKLHEVKSFLRGIEWARGYDALLKVSNDDKRLRKEQDYRNKELMTMIKDPQTEKEK